MKYITTAIFAILFNDCAFATAQVPDLLIYQGDTLAIFSNPLEPYFEQAGNRDLPGFESSFMSTNCWRGYMAIWELKNDSLFLRCITACNARCGTHKDADLLQMFGSSRVFAHWFSGKIMAPKGKLVQYIHLGYASIYEETQIFSFRHGMNTNIRNRSNKKIADKIARVDRNRLMEKQSIDTIFYHIKRNINWAQLDSTKYMCDDEYDLTFNKHGAIKKVKFAPWTDTKWEDRMYNYTERTCRRRIKKSLKNLRLDYLKPESTFTVRIEIFYVTKEKNLELWKPEWMEEDN